MPLSSITEQIIQFKKSGVSDAKGLQGCNMRLTKSQVRAIKASQQKKLAKVKCSYKKFHMATSEYPDSCAYCGWSPKVIRKSDVK